MATRQFADLSSYRRALDNAQGTTDLLNSILGGVQQGVQISQLPQQIEQNAIAQQLNQAIQAQKLADLQQGKVIEVGNTLVRQDPVTGEYKSVYTAPSTSSATPESQQFAGFDALGNALQFGTRGSGITRAPVQTGINVSGPLQPKTQTAMRKGVLIQDKDGKIKYDVLGEGESVSEGSKIYTTPTAVDEGGLRKEFLGNQVVKDFTDIAPQYQRVQSAMDEAKTSKNYTAVDQTLVNTFNRILDPSSVVREAEYARTAEDQSVMQYLRGKYDPKTGRLFIGGAGLTPETRDAMARMAKRFYDTAQNNYTQTSAFYSNVAQNRGFDPSLIIPPIGGFNFTQPSLSTNVATPASDAAPSAPVSSVVERLRQKHKVK